jgi:hypothetical protein
MNQSNYTYTTNVIHNSKNVGMYADYTVLCSVGSVLITLTHSLTELSPHKENKSYFEHSQNSSPSVNLRGRLCGSHYRNGPIDDS